MIKVTDFITKVYAQNEGPATGAGGTGGLATENKFDLAKFKFLNPWIPKDGADIDKTFSSLLGQIIGIVLTIAAITAFIYLLVAGFGYITSGGDAEKATKARAGIVNALIGILVILVAYLVLKYVGTSLFSFNSK